MLNRLALAPLTNGQSASDGTLLDTEYDWLVMRARGGFGLTMTCAAHVQEAGQGFAGQLGIFSDAHLPGLTRLAKGIREHGSLAVVQLHHAGMRAPQDLIGRRPLCPSDNPRSGALAMSPTAVEQAVEDFIVAAERADQAGFDGVELHGAHGYLIGQFLSPTINQRADAFGGSFENRSRFLWQIIEGIRNRCRPDFQLGLRLSAERFGVDLAEMRALCADILSSEKVEYVDLSLWDVFKRPGSEESGPLLFDSFADLPRCGTRLGMAGKIRTPKEARRALDMGADFLLLGRAAILDHDFPNRLRDDAQFVPSAMPASEEHLRAQGVSAPFFQYLRQFDGMVEDPDKASSR